MSSSLKTEMQAVRDGLRRSNVEAIFATIHMSLTQGLFLTNYIVDLGSSNFVCGVVESLPFFVQFTYFLSPLLVRRLKYRRPVATYFFLAHRVSWILLIGLLFVDWSPMVKQILMLLTLLLANACAVIAGNAWFSWMTDLVPPAIRGSYYGRRSAFLGVVSMVGMYLGGMLLTDFAKRGIKDIGYTICFSIAILSAVYSATIMARQHEPAMKPIPEMSFRKLSSFVKKSPLLKDLILFYMLWQGSMGISVAFFGVQMVRSFKMTPQQMATQALVSGSAALLGSRLWGRAMDRLGERTVVLGSGVLISLHVLLWLPAQRGFLTPVWITSVVGGFAWAGFGIAFWSWQQKLCGEGERQYTFGLLGLFSGPAFVVGSLLGGVLTTKLPETLFYINSFPVTHFHLVFVLSSIGRILAIRMIARRSLPYARVKRSISLCLIDSVKRMWG